MDTSMTPPEHSEAGRKNRGIKPNRRSFVLQVILPLMIGVLILAAAIMLLWQTGIGTASAWADTSLIFLLLPWLCVGVVPLALLAALWYGVFKLTAWLPVPLRKAQGYIVQARDYLRRGTDLALKPMFIAKGAWAVVTTFFRGLASLFGWNDGEHYG
jgi:hypothetical protein